MAPELSTILDWTGFIVLAALAISGGLLTVMSRRLVHAALWLATLLMAMAGFFLFLGNEFLAGVQVLIYVGAILTLILFAIMFTTQEEEAEESRRLEERLLRERGDL